MNNERRKLLNALGKQRRNLIKNGALPSELKNTYGIDPTVNFGQLSTAKLKEIKEKTTFKGGLTVEKGYIYSVEYLHRYNAYSSVTGQKVKKAKGNRRVSTLEKIKESRLMTEYSGVANIRSSVKFSQNSFKNFYAKQVEQYAPDLAKKIKKMKYTNFVKMLDSRGGLLDMEELLKVFPSDSQKYALDDGTDIEAERSTFIHNLGNALKLF